MGLLCRTLCLGEQSLASDPDIFHISDMCRFVLLLCLVFSSGLTQRRQKNGGKLNQLWEWYQTKVDTGGVACDCGPVEARLRGLGRDLAKLGEKLHQLEMAIGEFSLQQATNLQATQLPAQAAQLLTTASPAAWSEENTSPSTTSTTTTTTIETFESTSSEFEPTEAFPRLNCGGRGFYQVGHSCYSFTFYRSLSFEDAEAFCKVSGGFLARTTSAEEVTHIRRHLLDHIAANIYPGEHVSFYLGSASGEGLEDHNCKREANQGECRALAWDPDSNCKFTLANVECGLRDRFICERDPID